MAEKEQDVRHAQLRDRSQLQKKLLTRGQVFAFVLSLVIVLGGVWLILNDKPSTGFIALLTGVGVVTAPYLFRVGTARSQKAAADRDQT